MNAFHPENRPGLLVWVTRPDDDRPNAEVVIGWVEARDFDVKGGENLLLPVSTEDLVDMSDGWVERALDHPRSIIRASAPTAEGVYGPKAS
jgi:hypothetical protein